MADPGGDHRGKGEEQPLQRAKPSWKPTLVAQATLCLALYAALNVWIPRALKGGAGGSAGAGEPARGTPDSSPDLYFLSVAGGPRPGHEQSQLLLQMDAVAKATKVKFALVLSEMGEDDPLMQNATLYFPSLKVPWYVTGASKTKGAGYFIKQVGITHNQTLDIFSLDTRLFQESMRNISQNSREQMHWLTRQLKESTSKWHIAVGFHPLLVCETEQYVTWKTKLYDCLHDVFLRNRVSAYLSTVGCTGHYAQRSGIAFLGNPGPADRVHNVPLRNETSNLNSEMWNTFFLHRVNALEIESYFFNSSGHVMSRYTLHQGGREVM